MLASARLASMSPYSALATSLGPPYFSSSLATYASTNPYHPLLPPQPIAVVGPPSNATMAILHSLHQKGLDCSTASFTAKDVSVSLWGI